MHDRPAHLLRARGSFAVEWEVSVTEILLGFYEPDERGRRRPESFYGSLNMWAHLQRLGELVARCTLYG